MFLKLLFVGYLRRTSNYLERITPSDQTYIIDLEAINVETLRIDSKYSLEKEFTKLIHINSLNEIIPNYQSTLFM